MAAWLLGSYRFLEARLCRWCCAPILVHWYSFCQPQKDDRLSQPHLVLIQQLMGLELRTRRSKTNHRSCEAQIQSQQPVHSLVAIRRGLCSTRPSTRHRPTWSGVFSTSSCLFGKLKKFSKSFFSLCRGTALSLRNFSKYFPLLSEACWATFGNDPYLRHTINFIYAPEPFIFLGVSRMLTEHFVADCVLLKECICWNIIYLLRK